ncbi:MAG: AN1-type zinc finger domain-containing protein [Candidatus Hodarchaeota archaeon]
MSFCEFCGNEIGYLPFKCKYCGGTYCKKHRLPENHECTFELKHVPVVPTTSLGRRIRYQEGTESGVYQEDYRQKKPKELKKYLKRQERQRDQTIRDYGRTYGWSRQTNGTLFLIISIIVVSIVGIIIPLFIGLSLYGLLNFFIWTIFTSPFAYVLGFDLIGVFFMFIFLLIFFNLCKNIELRYGSKFLLKLYLFCAAFKGLFYILLRLLFTLIYPISITYAFPVGLASAALIGLIAFMIYPNQNREMAFLACFVPVRMKGRTIIILLTLFSIIPAILYGIFYHPLYFAVYLSDLGGIFASYLVYYFKYR